MLILLPVFLFAVDFGFMTSQYASFGNPDVEENKFTYKGIFYPRFSSPVGKSGDFSMTAGLTLGAENGFYCVPELLRTEFMLRFGAGGLRVGRMFYSDPVSFVASGLFDGAQYYFISKAGTLSAGVWYTGLLYKETANITMTQSDLQNFNAAIDYGEFADTYFAPPRLLASIDWEHPAIAGQISLKTALTAQFDLSDNDDKLHSQYLTMKAGLTVKKFIFEFGYSLETAQNQGVSAEEEDESVFTIAFAWDAGVYWMLPTPFTSRLSFNGHFAGGRAAGNDTVYAFTPVTVKYYGDIFKQKMSGLTVLNLNYTARIASALSASAVVSHFVRNDLGTFSGYPVNAEENGGFSLGTEFFARLIWSPFSDFQVNFGGGAFLPALGSAGPDEKAQWKIELTAVLSIY